MRPTINPHSTVYKGPHLCSLGRLAKYTHRDLCSILSLKSRREMDSEMRLIMFLGALANYSTAFPLYQK